MRAAPDVLTSGGGSDIPAEADERAPEAASSTAGKKGRVLLVEDDASFRETIHDFLTENGYQVVAARNGTEGIKEALAGDFALILCDMMMPALPGEMFYRAVERVRPRMGERFVFMTGYRGDQKTNDFIGSINGYVLQKPFPLQHLLDSIALAEVRRTFVSVFDTASTAPVGPQAIPPTDPYLARIASLRPESSVAAELPARQPDEIETPALPASSASVPQKPACSLRVAERPSRASGVFRPFIFAGLALFMVLAVNLGIRTPLAKDRALAAAADRRALEAQWMRVSAEQQHAEEAHAAYGSLKERAERLDRERKGGWTGPLRSITKVAGQEIVLTGLVASGGAGSLGGCRIIIQGLATGREPRAIVEAFQNALRREAERNSGAAVVTALNSFEAKPVVPSAPADRRRASFNITMSIEADQARKSESGAVK